MSKIKPLPAVQSALEAERKRILADVLDHLLEAAAQGRYLSLHEAFTETAPVHQGELMKWSLFNYWYYRTAQGQEARDEYRNAVVPMIGDMLRIGLPQAVERQLQIATSPDSLDRDATAAFKALTPFAQIVGTFGEAKVSQESVAPVVQLLIQQFAGADQKVSVARLTAPEADDDQA